MESIASSVTMYEGCTIDVSSIKAVTPIAWNKNAKASTDTMHQVCYNLLGGKLHATMQKAVDEDYTETHAANYNKSNGSKQVLIKLLPEVDDTTCRMLAVCAKFSTLQLQCAWETRKANLKQVSVRSLNPRGIAEGLKTCYPEQYAEITGRAISTSAPSTPSLDADTKADEDSKALQGRAEHAETAELGARAWMLKNVLELIPAEWIVDYPEEFANVEAAIKYCKQGGKLPA